MRNDPAGEIGTPHSLPVSCLKRSRTIIYNHVYIVLYHIIYDYIVYMFMIFYNVVYIQLYIYDYI